MTKKFRVWLDSGANIHSCREIYISLTDLGYTDEYWDSMDEATRDEVMRDIAFERMDWGYAEEE